MFNYCLPIHSSKSPKRDQNEGPIFEGEEYCYSICHSSGKQNSYNYRSWFTGTLQAF